MPHTTKNRLVTGIKLANRRVFETAQSDARYRGMGTTIVGMVWRTDGHLHGARRRLAWLFWCARARSPRSPRTHSLLNDYLKVHKLTAAEIEHFPHKKTSSCAPSA